MLHHMNPKTHHPTLRTLDLVSLTHLPMLLNPLHSHCLTAPVLAKNGQSVDESFGEWAGSKPFFLLALETGVMFDFWDALAAG